MLMRNVNRAAASRRSPSAIPPTIVAPERETPGTSASACATPIANAPGARQRSSPPRARAEPLDRRSSKPAPTSSATAATSRRPRRASRPRPTREQADDDDRNGAGDDQPDPPPVRTAARAERPRQRRAPSPTDVAREEHHTASERADVARRRRTAGRTLLGVPAEERAREDQVRRARHRQELRESLHDAEERGGNEVHAARLRRAGRGALRARRPWPAGGAPAAPQPHRRAQDDGDRRRDEDGRVRAGDDADEHREREALEHLAAEQEQRDDRQERRAGGDDGPRQRLVHALVDDRVERLAPARAAGSRARGRRRRSCR